MSGTVFSAHKRNPIFKLKHNKIFDAREPTNKNTMLQSVVMFKTLKLIRGIFEQKYILCLILILILMAINTVVDSKKICILRKKKTGNKKGFLLSYLIPPQG